MALAWEDDSSVTVSLNFIGYLDSDTILVRWWEKDYYATGDGAEVAGALTISTGKVSRFRRFHVRTNPA